MKESDFTIFVSSYRYNSKKFHDNFSNELFKPSSRRIPFPKIINSFGDIGKIYQTQNSYEATRGTPMTSARGVRGRHIVQTKVYTRSWVNYECVIQAVYQTNNFYHVAYAF